MTIFNASTVAFLALAAALWASAPAGAQQNYLYGERNFGKACRPPLKYAAGACVRRCPAGYRARGRYCKPPGTVLGR
ncbi:MAG: hypothetical protein PGN34_25135 [Methylobacterium frigidaeris]